MKTSRFLVILFGLVVTGFALSAAETSGGEKPALDSHLEPLRPWVGKTWKGTFKNSTPEKPTIDIARWERALNGRAVRILHSINEGAYGGETIVRWDEQKQALVYHYFTTAGFTTTGTMSFKEGKVFTHEVVNGAATGVTEVRATIEMRRDGTFHIKTEHLKNGEWAPGRETTYREDPSAQVIFK
jgi:hypothetical protein